MSTDKIDIEHLERTKLLTDAIRENLQAIVTIMPDSSELKALADDSRALLDNLKKVAEVYNPPLDVDLLKESVSSSAALLENLKEIDDLKED
jgi:hypothetical protein